MVAGRTFHPALEGRGEEVRALADAVRRLIELAVTNDAPPDLLVEATAALWAVADTLEAGVPSAPGDRLLSAEVRERVSDTLATDGEMLERAMPYDVIIGACNPLAPPLRLRFDPPVATATVTYGAAYEGAPGCVHGAALAAAFDIVLTAANVVADAGGPTVNLHLTYLRPTLVDVEARFEATVTSRTERRVHSEGRLIQNGKVTMEATGEFAVLDRARVARMASRARGSEE
jgi:acyl-coenzyme A thioesterase PaaI-like protein